VVTRDIIQFIEISSVGDGRREFGGEADGISLTNYTWELYYV